jgi:HEAT repeat protein
MDLAPMTVRKWLIWISIIAFVVVLGITVRMNIETRGDRIAVAEKLQSLKKEFLANPSNLAPLNEMVSYLNGNWSFARTYAVCTIGEIGPLAQPVVKDLIAALNCGDLFVEREAARSLGEVAVGMSEPVPYLIDKMQRPYRDSAWFSAQALGEIGEPALVAIPALEEASHSHVEVMAYRAEEALKKLKKIKESKAGN